MQLVGDGLGGVQPDVGVSGDGVQHHEDEEAAVSVPEEKQGAHHSSNCRLRCLPPSTSGISSPVRIWVCLR